MSVGFIFSGQGAQSVGMGNTLFQSSPSARTIYLNADKVLGYDLTEIAFNGPKELLTETRFCQPALYVHGCAVVAAMREKGSMPSCAGTAGLSLGELTALHLAGVFDFETGLQIVAERARLMQECCEAEPSGMAALIGGSPEAARALCSKHDVDIANLNCPGQIVVSGREAAIESVVAEAKPAGFKTAVLLQVAGAYHSRLMAPAAQQFGQFVQKFPFAHPQLPVFSNVTGKAVSTGDEARRLLIEQITAPVLWERCFQGLCDLSIKEFCECGPGNTLAGFAKRIGRDAVVKAKAEWTDL